MWNLQVWPLMQKKIQVFLGWKLMICRRKAWHLFDLTTRTLFATNDSQGWKRSQKKKIVSGRTWFSAKSFSMRGFWKVTFLKCTVVGGSSAMPAIRTTQPKAFWGVIKQCIKRGGSHATCVPWPSIPNQSWRATWSLCMTRKPESLESPRPRCATIAEWPIQRTLFRSASHQLSYILLLL